MHRGIKTAFNFNPKLIPVLELDVNESIGESVSLLQTLSARVINTEAIALSPADYYEGFTKAIDRTFELHQLVGPSLDNLLKIRIDNFYSLSFARKF